MYSKELVGFSGLRLGSSGGLLFTRNRNLEEFLGQVRIMTIRISSMGKWIHDDVFMRFSHGLMIKSSRFHPLSIRSSVNYIKCNAHQILDEGA